MCTKEPSRKAKATVSLPRCSMEAPCCQEAIDFNSLLPLGAAVSSQHPRLLLKTCRRTTQHFAIGPKMSVGNAHPASSLTGRSTSSCLA